MRVHEIGSWDAELWLLAERSNDNDEVADTDTSSRF